MNRANRLSNAGWKVGFFEQGTIDTSIDGGATIQSEPDTAVGWTLHGKKTILIRSGMSVEKSVLTFAHEYEHAFGGGERQAFAGMARASLALRQIGGVSANSAFMQQFMTNATVDIAKINTYMTTRETTAGDLYSKQIFGVHPAAWSRVF